MTLKELREFIASHKWTFASTMRRYPHWYLLQKNVNDETEFFRFVDFIRSHGYDELFLNRIVRYLDIDGYKYWVMRTVDLDYYLINRAKLKSTDKPHVFHKNQLPRLPRKKYKSVKSKPINFAERARRK